MSNEKLLFKAYLPSGTAVTFFTPRKSDYLSEVVDGIMNARSVYTRSGSYAFTRHFTELEYLGDTPLK